MLINKAVGGAESLPAKDASAITENRALRRSTLHLSPATMLDEWLLAENRGWRNSLL